MTFTKGQKIIYMRLCRGERVADEVPATYCSEYAVRSWRRHHIYFTDNGRLVHRYVSSAAIRDAVSESASL